MQPTRAREVLDRNTYAQRPVGHQHVHVAPRPLPVVVHPQRPAVMLERPSGFFNIFRRQPAPVYVQPVPRPVIYHPTPVVYGLPSTGVFVRVGAVALAALFLLALAICLL